MTSVSSDFQKNDLRIDITKYAAISLNFLNVVFFSHFYGDGALVDYVFYISLSIILNSLFDLGLNTLNCDMKLSNNIFYGYGKEHTLKIAIYFLAVIAILFLIFKNNYLILLACFLQLLPGIYIMRFLSIKRRSKEILNSIFFGELIPSLIKLAIILSLSFFSNSILAIFSISIGLLVFSIYLSSTQKIRGLNLILFLKNDRFIEFKISGYALSVFYSIKNQIFGIALPALANEGQRNLFALLSRINALIISLFSPIVARIPLHINKNSIDYKFYIFISSLIFCFIVTGSYFWIEIINLFSIIFSSGTFILNSWAFYLFIFLMINIFIIFNSQILIFTGKINLSFFLELIYFSGLLSLIIYNF